MKFYLGMLLGLIVGGISATVYVSHAQVLTPYDATIEQRLDWDRIGSALRLERDIERWEHERDGSYHSPCP